MNLVQSITELIEEASGPLSIYEVERILHESNGVEKGEGYSVKDIYSSVIAPSNQLKLTPEGLIRKIDFSEEAEIERRLLSFSLVLTHLFASQASPNAPNLLIPALITYLRVTWYGPEIAKKGHQVPNFLSPDKLLEDSSLTSAFLRELQKLNLSPFFQGTLSGILNGFRNLPSSSLERALKKSLDPGNMDIFERADEEIFGKVFNHLLFSLCPSQSSLDYLFPPATLTSLLADLVVPMKADASVFSPIATTGRPLSDLRWHEELGTNPNSISWLAQFTQNTTSALGKMNLLMNGFYQQFLFRPGFSGKPGTVEPQSIDLILACLPLSYREFAPIHPKMDFLQVGRSARMDKVCLIETLYYMNESGRAVLSVPDEILYEDKDDAKKIREYLLMTDAVEAVISLPMGIFHQHPETKVSLLILNRAKPEDRAGKVLFIDGTVDNIRINNAITVVHRKRIRGALERFEAEQGYAYLTTVEQILENDLNLEPMRYVQVIGELIGSMKATGEQLVSIREVVTQTWFKPLEDEIPLPYLSVKELSDSEVDFMLNPEELPRLNFPERGASVLSESAVLVARVGSRIRPTFFKFKDKPIAFSSSVFALVVDPEKVRTEYLIFELGSNFVRRQFEGYCRGVAHPTISLKDFLAIQMRIPPLAEQDRRIADRKEYLYEAKLREAELVKAKLRIEEADYRLLATFKHNTMQHLERISSGLKVVKFFLENKEERSTDFSLEEPVMEPFPGEDPEDIEKVGSVLNRLERNINGLIDSLEQNIADIEAGRTPLHMSTVNLYAFFKDELLPELGQSSLWRIELDVPDRKRSIPDQEVDLDKNRFREVIYNLIKNAEKHGFREERDKPYRIRFEFSEKRMGGTGYVRLIYRNDGAAFTRGFSFEDFIQRGKRAGAGANEGIGGNFINRIIQKHGGIFREVPDAELIPDSPWNVNFEILLPGKIE